VELGYRTHVLWDLTRPVSPESDIPTRLRFENLGVDVIDSTALA